MLAGPDSGSRPSSDATSVIRDEMTLGGHWEACGFVRGGLLAGGGIDEAVSPDAITAMSLTVVLSDDITSTHGNSGRGSKEKITPVFLAVPRFVL
jgi:hypothetical protein